MRKEMPTSRAPASSTSASELTSKLTTGTSVWPTCPPTSRENALAACPPPTFVTSRSASSCRELGSCKLVLQKPWDVENENGTAAAENRNPGKAGDQLPRPGQHFEHNPFWTQELVQH